MLLTPLTKKEKKAAKASRKSFASPPDDERVIYSAEARAFDDDNDSSGPTAVKHDAKKERIEAERIEAERIENERLAEEERVEADQRIANAMREKTAADALRKIEQERRKIREEFRKEADNNERLRQISENNIKANQVKVEAQKRQLDKMLKETQVAEENIAKEKARAAAMIAANAKLEAETRERLLKLISDASAASSIMTAPPIASPSTAASAPMRSLTVMPMVRKKPDGTTTALFFQDARISMLRISLSI
jgi:hypothetical protein